MTTQDPRHGPCRHAELWSKPVLPAAMLDSSGKHGCFDFIAGAGRHQTRSRTAVVQTDIALRIEARHPTMRALAGHTPIALAT